MALLEGKLRVKDLPEAWNERYRQDIGILPADDRDGCMQDVHWYGGRIGGSFQGYTLGNLFSALFFNSAVKARPQIPEDIRLGKFDSLHSWLKDNIYQHGSKFTAEELVQRTTGGPITIAPYITYLKTKYNELYDL
jgi:carboxypeptidase Taq